MAKRLCPPLPSPLHWLMKKIPEPPPAPASYRGRPGDSHRHGQATHTRWGGSPGAASVPLGVAAWWKDGIRALVGGWVTGHLGQAGPCGRRAEARGREESRRAQTQTIAGTAFGPTLCP